MTGIDLSVKIGKLRLKTPFVCASGTFGYGAELKGLADFNSIGAFVTKTITLNPREGNIPPRIVEIECGVLNSIGLENQGVEEFIKEKLPQILKLNTPFLVSIGSQDIEGYKKLLRRLDNEKAVNAIEVNLSCPNLKLKKMISQSAKYTYKLVKALREMTQKTLVVKVTGEVEDIVKIARAVCEAGADGISLVNTFYGLAFDITERKPYLGNVYGGYSGKGIKPLSLYRVWQAAQHVDIPIIGGGGVFSANDAVEFILAGAHAVSVGTATFTNPCVTKEMSKGLTAYMRSQKVTRIDQLRGAISL